MFLCTTADRRLWDGKARALFLGEWCLLYSERDHCRGLDYEVMPYPFDDREKLYQAYCYLQPIYRRALDRLAAVLNDIHQSRHSVRFWEIVVGYWLREFMEILYERYICLTRAVESYPIRATRVLSPSSYVTPSDSHHFATLYQRDFYNAQLYSQIIRQLHLPDIKVEEVPIREWVNDHQARTLQKRLLLRLKNAVCQVSLACARRNRIFLVSTYFPHAELLRLSLRSGLFPLLDTPRIPIPARGGINRTFRELLQQPKAENEFERILWDGIADNLPRIFLEEFEAAGAVVRRRFPKSVDLIVTANGFAYNDLFKRWTAMQVECGVPFVILQHGGSYGCARWNSSEDYEVGVADRYYTFGWEDKSKGNVVPWSASRLRGRLSRSGDARRKGDILWVVVSYPRYAYTMYSVPVGPQVLPYLEYQHRFARAVSHEVKALLLYRPYFLRYGWHDEERLQDMAGDIRIASIAESMRRQLKRSRLFVGTFNATAFLETFVAQVPTVLFWDPKLWELRPEAQPFFDRLRSVGILHDTPESAAGFIETIYRDPEAWWQQAGVQDAVASFCARYARAEDRSLHDWQAEFERVARAAWVERARPSPQESIQ